ncbi:MAG: hypothetical protein RL368_1896 [Pseudomonadota bacterium]
MSRKTILWLVRVVNKWKFIYVVFSLSLLSGTALASSTTACSIWNLANDFRTFPNHENPNRDYCGNSGVWSFMQSTTLKRDPSTYTLLPSDSTEMGVLLELPQIHEWQGTHSGNDVAQHFPFVFKNDTAQIIKNQRTMAGFASPPNTIVLHPAPDGLAIVGWRSPFEGKISINGSVSKLQQGCSNGGIAWSIDQGSTNLTSGSITATVLNQPFQLTNIAVHNGDVIYFSIDPQGDFYCDSTALDVTIEATPPVGCPPDTNGSTQEGIKKCTDNPASCGITIKSLGGFSQSELTLQVDGAKQDGVKMGMQSCKDHPKNCDLFTQDDLNAAKQTGIQSCKDNPASCGLFNQNQVDSLIQAAISQCKADPASCGIVVGIFTQAQLDAAVKKAIQNCQVNPSSCGIKMIDKVAAPYLTKDMKLVIPYLEYRDILFPMNLWVEMNYIPSSTTPLVFNVSNYGVIP